MSPDHVEGPSGPHALLDSRVRRELDALSRSRAVASVSAGAPDAPTVFDAMAASRLIDIEARRLRAEGLGYYTIGSAGHESNAIVALGLRQDDPALLHYRSGAFFVARALQAGRTLDDAIRAVLLGMFAATADPASGGRHKVFGDPALAIIPQTSTIASHLPRAVGVAFAIGRAKRLGVPSRWPTDAVVVCSFGDASLNHSTAAGALNAAGYCVQQELPLPLVLVCEDNGLGISVPTPQGWVGQAARRPGIHYLAAEGDDPVSVKKAVAEAVELARHQQKPVLLHLRTVRYLGHAGTDVETGYRSWAAIESDFARDPLLAVARLLPVGFDAIQRYDALAAMVRRLSAEVAKAPRLLTADAVVAPLAPRPAKPVRTAGALSAPDRLRTFSGKLPEEGGPLTLAQAINAALTDVLAARREVLVFGEDVGRKGGVYGVTRGLQQRFGAARVFDTLLDEQSILGLGLGLGVSGLLPIPEIQYLAYLHNAEDQLRGEAACLRFFSNGAYTNPMVVRIAGLAYQKGFGGHFHNDNAVGVLRDIPGLVIAVPSRPGDAAPLLRACVGAAASAGQVSVFLEPIALYHERDLYQVGDRGWLANYSPGAVAEIGTTRSHGDGTDLTIVTFGNGVRMSLRVAKRLETRSISARVVDLRFLNPLPMADVLRAAEATGRVLVVDETRRTGGVGEGVVSGLVEAGFTGRIGRISSRDSYVPLGPAAALVLLSERDIEHAAAELLDARRPIRVVP